MGYYDNRGSVFIINIIILIIFTYYLFLFRTLDHIINNERTTGTISGFTTRKNGTEYNFNNHLNFDI
jgi:hypothetical protein